MTGKGVVKSVDREVIILAVTRQSACVGNCASCGGCEIENIIIKAKCDFEVNVGDVVEFSSNTSSILLGLVVTFIFPIVFPLIAYFVFLNLGLAVACLAACVCFAISVVMVWALSKHKKYIRSTVPRVIKVITKK